jgi:hypothetical protein
MRCTLLPRLLCWCYGCLSAQAAAITCLITCPLPDALLLLMFDTSRITLLYPAQHIFWALLNCRSMLLLTGTMLLLLCIMRLFKHCHAPAALPAATSARP